MSLAQQAWRVDEMLLAVAAALTCTSAPAARAAASLLLLGCRVGQSRRGGLLRLLGLWRGRGDVLRRLLGGSCCCCFFFLRNQGDKCFS